MNQDIYLTEIGMYESADNPNWTGIKVPRTEALVNLKNQMELLRLDPQTKAYLLFDSFATNPDTNFAYNFMTDSDIDGVINPFCFLPNDVDIDQDGKLGVSDIRLQLLNWIVPPNVRTDTDGNGVTNALDFGWLWSLWKN